ncbi:22291_t:CDS:2 [Gigaspora rosea]|nr:22291_t:CDS:2 [Gigaspora rosea]
MHIREEVKNILLIGSAGKGKSILANIVTGTNEFEESSSRIYGTNKPKSKEFEDEGIKYRIIDTLGISDSTITDYATIVCTNFPDFEDYKACERDHKIFCEETKKFSEQLACTKIIYVDNLPAKGRYQSIAKESIKESRNKLLAHLQTFKKFTDLNYLQDLVKERMKQRSMINAIGNTFVLGGKAFIISGILFLLAFLPGAVMAACGLMGVVVSDATATINENKAHKKFDKYLTADKERSINLENLQLKLKEAVGKFEEIHSSFEDLEYKEKNIDRKKIGIIKNVLKKILGEGINADMSLEVDNKIDPSICQKAVKVVVEAFCKLVFSPLPLYYIQRDNKEIECRTSTQNMEKIIKS